VRNPHAAVVREEVAAGGRPDLGGDLRQLGDLAVPPVRADRQRRADADSAALALDIDASDPLSFTHQCLHRPAETRGHAGGASRVPAEDRIEPLTAQRVAVSAPALPVALAVDRQAHPAGLRPDLQAIAHRAGALHRVDHAEALEHGRRARPDEMGALSRFQGLTRSRDRKHSIFSP